MQNKINTKSKKIIYPFDLEVKINFLCPHFKKEKGWEEMICKKCGYDEQLEELTNKPLDKNWNKYWNN